MAAKRRRLNDKHRVAVSMLIQGFGQDEIATKLGVSRTTLYKWRQEEFFKEEYERQMAESVRQLEAVGMERAKSKSDTLLIFFLKANKAEKYDDAIRKVKYLNDNELEDPESRNVNVIFADAMEDLDDASVEH